MDLEKTQRLYQYLQLNSLHANVNGRHSVFFGFHYLNKIAKFMQMTQVAMFHNTMTPNYKYPLVRVLLRRSKLVTNNFYKSQTWMDFYSNAGGLLETLLFAGIIFLWPFTRIVFQLEKSIEIEYARSFVKWQDGSDL